jgi:putative transposase
MRTPQATPLTVTPAQRALLQRLARRQTADQRLVRRATILLALVADPCVEATARRLRLTRLTVRHWRDRWLQAAPPLQQAEQEQAPEPTLLALIEQVLADAPRPGAPATFSPEQIVQLVAVACEPPEQSGRPIDHWTARELADEVKKRRIVQDISPRSAGRFLKRGRPAAAQEPVLVEC